MGPKNYILLTGGTGLLGQFLLPDLLRARLPVAALVRPGKEADAAARIHQQLARSEKLLNRRFPRPVVLSGELTAPNLGLSNADRQWLRQHCGRVLHSAAYVSFKPAETHPTGEPFTTNVDGTQRLAEFCFAHDIPEFHHISSAFACGMREGVVLESEGQVGQQFSNDYEASKCNAEELLRREFRPECLTVYRPSIVIDPSPAAVPISDQTIYLAFSIYQLLGQRVGLPEPADLLSRLGLTGDERKNIVPVNWISRLIVQILRTATLHGRTYHLTHPRGTTLRDVVHVFHNELVAAGHQQMKGSLSDARFGELSGLIDQFIETFSPYFRDDPHFDRVETRRAMAVCGEPECPDVDHAILRNIARQQMEPRALRKPLVDKTPETLWGRWLVTASTNNASGENTWGLVLSGPEGGDWQIALDELNEPACSQGGAEDSNCVLYTSSRTWDQLIRGQISFDAAAREGRVVLEVNSGEAPESFTKNLEQFLSVIAERSDVSRGVEKVTDYAD